MYISLAGYANTLKTDLLSKSGILVNQSSIQHIVHEKSKTIEKEDLTYWKEKITTYFSSADSYQNPYLTMNDLALTLNTNRSVISKVINQEFQMNFNDL